MDEMNIRDRKDKYFDPPSLKLLKKIKFVGDRLAETFEIKHCEKNKQFKNTLKISIYLKNIFYTFI